MSGIQESVEAGRMLVPKFRGGVGDRVLGS